MLIKILGLMQYTNAEAIKAGYPRSAVLPGSAFWKKARSFQSKTSILNFDPVTTSKAGASIVLDAVKADFSGALGSITLLKGAVNMSAAPDSILVRCISSSLVSSEAGLDLSSPDWLNSPVTLNLGGGDNSVLAGLGRSGWNTGIHVGDRSSLLSGIGKDILKGTGSQIGIDVGGTIGTGAGADVIEGRGGGSYGITLSNGRVDMGAGNDRLTGLSDSQASSGESNYLNGWIDMGDGDDQITGSGFRFNGPYGIQMGAGNDRFVAALFFSNTPFDFGAGIDRLYLPAGQYTASSQVEGGFSLFSAALTAGQPTYGAERIAGLELLVSAQTGVEYAFVEGVITIA
jgi:hypothetical protein